MIINIIHFYANPFFFNKSINCLCSVGRGASIPGESGKFCKEQKEFVMKTISRIVEHVNNE